jgi:hypothetical protein
MNALHTMIVQITRLGKCPELAEQAKRQVGYPHPRRSPFCSHPSGDGRSFPGFEDTAILPREKTSVALNSMPHGEMAVVECSDEGAGRRATFVLSRSP